SRQASGTAHFSFFNRTAAGEAISREPRLFNKDPWLRGAAHVCTFLLRAFFRIEYIRATSTAWLLIDEVRGGQLMTRLCDVRCESDLARHGADQRRAGMERGGSPDARTRQPAGARGAADRRCVRAGG